MTIEKEKIKVYVCKSSSGARKLFELFKSMNLDNLDEDKFFYVCKCGNNDISFTVRFNTWQIGEMESNPHFEIIETEVFK